MSKSKVASNNIARINNQVVKVIKPYKAPHFWVTEIIDSPEPDKIGKTMIYSAGTIRFFRIKV